MSQRHILYRLRFPRGRRHYVEVEATYPVTPGKPVDLFMPVWTPGSYLVRDYSRHVEEVRARSPKGKAVPLCKVAKNRWRADSCSERDLVVRYVVYCREMTVRTNGVDDEFALLNGAPTFLAMDGALDDPHKLELELPENWNTTVTGLPADPGGQAHCYLARDYDVLVDSPVLAGHPSIARFEVREKTHLLVSQGGEPFWDGRRAARDVRKIVQVVSDFWKDMPYDRFVFMNLIVEKAGGLEHRNSTVLMCSRWDFRDPRRYRRWLALVSHEYFHTWNVKRLRPVALGPFQYETENYTRALWIAEGLTSYYDSLLLVRAGLIEREEYLKGLSRQIETVQNTPGRYVRCLELSSFDAWIKQYKPDEHSLNSSISYYTKGAVVGFLLDAKIRHATEGKKSLDDVMRLAFGRFSGERGFTEAEFEAVASEVAETDLKDWFTTAVRSTEDLDYGEALDLYGLAFRDTASGGKGVGSAPEAAVWLGMETEEREGRLLVKTVRADSPAHRSGFDAEDELLALDGFRLDVAGWKDRLKQYRAGDKAEFLLSRRQKLHTIPVVFAEKPPESWVLQVREKQSARQKQELAAWLASASGSRPPTGKDATVR